MTPVTLPNTRIITISGRIASGSTTLAKKISQVLNWRHIEGGEIFWEATRQKLNLSAKDTGLRPDEEDQAFEEYQKKLLKEEKQIVLETKLAGFLAKDFQDVFRILVLCEDANGVDQTEIRIDRLVNREHMSIEEAKEEVLVREKSDIEKWRRLYAQNAPEWVYWDRKYYNMVINTYSHDQDETVAFVLEKVGFRE